MLMRASEADAERIAALHIDSWRATYAEELSPEFLRNQDLASRAAEWRRRIAEGVIILLAWEDATTVGFVACGPAGGVHANPEEWGSYNLHVAPLRQGKGLGSQLYEAAVDWGSKRGARECVLWVVKTNSAARAFYERKGMLWDGGEQTHVVG